MNKQGEETHPGYFSIAFALTLLFVLGAFWLFFKIFAPPVDLLPEVSDLPRVVEEIKKEISLPPPLRAERKAPVSVLTRAGAIRWTNVERQNDGLPVLAENAKLNSAAEIKLKDMFARQFFAHVSPTGEGAADLVKKATYEFIAVGENLALGNFDGDKDLVTAWMNSPGHRANILSSTFHEIGVAVGKGMFEGKETWLAVQIFAKPISACPQPDPNLKAGIESAESKIGSLVQTANALKNEIENEKPKTRKETEEYNQKVDEYNSLAHQINALVEEVKILISRYNTQVRALNQCISG